jgi:hypothetical protein
MYRDFNTFRGGAIDVSIVFVEFGGDLDHLFEEMQRVTHIPNRRSFAPPRMTELVKGRVLRYAQDDKEIDKNEASTRTSFVRE